MICNIPNTVDIVPTLAISLKNYGEYIMESKYANDFYKVGKKWQIIIIIIISPT